jgi:tight adherence protein B
MRGLAALSACLSVWLMLGGRLPRITVRTPRLPPALEMARAFGVGVLAVLGILALSGPPMVTAATGILVAGATLVSRHVAAERRRRAIVEQWPDFLAIVRSRLASGLPMADAVVEAALHQGGPMGHLGSNLEASLRRGLPLQAALEEERLRLADPIADRVLTSLAFASGTGGGRVAEVLGMLGRAVGEELRLRHAHDAALTEQRLTAAVALGAPWALLLLTVTTNPQAARVYGTADGSRVVALGLVLTLSGFALARRSARLSASPRIFQ